MATEDRRRKCSSRNSRSLDPWCYSSYTDIPTNL